MTSAAISRNFSPPVPRETPDKRVTWVASDIAPLVSAETLPGETFSAETLSAEMLSAERLPLRFADPDRTGAGWPEQADAEQVVLGTRRETFDEYYRRDYRRLVGLAFVLSRSDWVAEDLVHDALTEAHRKWSTVSSYDDPGAWVRRVMINKSNSRFRRLKTETRGMLRLAGQAQHPIAATEPTTEVWDAVRALPTRQAQCIALHYWEDRSLAEIADILGCTRETVKTHLARGRKALSSTLASEQEGGES